MRAIAVLASTIPFAACTTTMAEPRILVSPYLAVYQLRGSVGMQSQPVPGQPLQDNPPQSMDTFGQDQYREDVGVRADIGDGFGGLRIDYYRLDMNSADPGTLEADYGQLQQGELVRMKATMDELRVGYLEPVVDVRTTWREQPLALKFAAGAVIAYRDMTLSARTDDGQRGQNVEIEGEVVYPAARFRAAWRDFAFDVEYAISPELALGGDFDGVMQDLEVRGSYTLAARDVTFFAGYRYSDLPAEGDANGFRYEADLIVDGFQFGVTVSF